MVQDKLVYGAIKGMLGTLDPHSAFLDPAQYHDMKAETAGQFGGVAQCDGMHRGQVIGDFLAKRHGDHRMVGFELRDLGSDGAEVGCHLARQVAECGGAYAIEHAQGLAHRNILKGHLQNNIL